jgi:hypothetical protein
MSTTDDYDNLSPAEREIRDKADRQREADEQAGMSHITRLFYAPNLSQSSSLLLETNSGRC